MFLQCDIAQVIIVECFLFLHKYTYIGIIFLREWTKQYFICMQVPRSIANLKKILWHWFSKNLWRSFLLATLLYFIQKGKASATRRFFLVLQIFFPLQEKKNFKLVFNIRRSKRFTKHVIHKTHCRKTIPITVQASLIDPPTGKVRAVFLIWNPIFQWLANIIRFKKISLLRWLR